MPSLTCNGPACSGKIFSNKYQLDYHMLSSPLHFHCTPCKKAFKNETAYKQHRNTSGEHSPYCDVCDVRCMSYEELEQHFKSAPRHMNCKACKVGFYDTKMLEAHRVYTHPKIACAQCPELGQKFQEEDLHKHYFSSSKHPSCVTCRLAFANGTAYTEHRRNMHSPGAGAASPAASQPDRSIIASPSTSSASYAEWNGPNGSGEADTSCPGPACKSRKFPSEAALLQHLKTSPAHIQCCGRGFRLETHYMQHRDTNPDHQPRCVLCDQDFRSFRELDAHFQSSSNHPNCDRCSKGFEHEKILRVHMICSHPTVICSQCPTVGPIYPEDLPDHYMQVDKHPKCEVCHLGFEDEILYEQHQLSQHGTSTDEGVIVSETVIPSCSDTIKEHVWQAPTSQDLFLSYLAFKEETKKAEPTPDTIALDGSPWTENPANTAQQDAPITQTVPEATIELPIPGFEGKIFKLADVLNALKALQPYDNGSSTAEDSPRPASAVVDSDARASAGAEDRCEDPGPTPKHADYRMEEVVADPHYNPWG